jgi:hypothetical protein
MVSMQLKWPSVIAQPLAALSMVLAAGHAPPLSLDCLVRSTGLGFSKEGVAVARVMLLFCMLFVMLSVLLLLELVYWYVGLLRRQFRFPRKPAVSLWHLVTRCMQLITLAAVFFFYPSLVRTCLQVFVCLPVQTGGSTAEVQRGWAGNANMQCGTGAHAVLRPTIYSCLFRHHGCPVCVF